MAARRRKVVRRKRKSRLNGTPNEHMHMAITYARRAQMHIEEAEELAAAGRCSEATTMFLSGMAMYGEFTANNHFTGGMHTADQRTLDAMASDAPGFIDRCYRTKK
jgi:hypothetical protein